MPETVTCPHCYKSLRLPGDEVPRVCVCPACGRRFGSLIDELEPAEGTYDARPPAPKTRPKSGRFCEVCDAEMREDATFCDVCTTRVHEDDEPDTEEKFDREKRRRRREKEDEEYLRIDLIVLQVAGVLVALAFVGCIPTAAIGIATLTTMFVGIYYLVHLERKPKEKDTDAAWRRWKRDGRVILMHLLINVGVAVLVAAAAVAILALR